MIGFSKLLCERATRTLAARLELSARTMAEMVQLSITGRPLVVWHATERCNQRCRSCRADAELPAAGEELTTPEAREMIRGLKEWGAVALLFSGGECLTRPDLLPLASYAAELGLRTAMLSNGSLITMALARGLRDAGVQYVAVALDGLADAHDRSRGRRGAFAEAVGGIRRCADAGVKAGIRFALDASSFSDLPGLLNLAEETRAARFSVMHMVYSNSDAAQRNREATPEQRRKAAGLLIARALEWDRGGAGAEILSTDHHPEGAYLYAYIGQGASDRVEEIHRLLAAGGSGCEGCRMATVSADGTVYSCPFRGRVALGNVKESRVADLWNSQRIPALLE